MYATGTQKHQETSDDMKKVKSRDEIIASPYVTKTEIRRLFGESYGTSTRIYQKALEKDRIELKDRLIYPYGEKVRLESVCWVMGIKLKDLKSGTAVGK